MSVEENYLNEGGLEHLLTTMKEELASKEESKLASSPNAITGTQYATYESTVLVSSIVGSMSVSVEDPTIVSVETDDDRLLVTWLKTGQTTITVTDTGSESVKAGAVDIFVDITADIIANVSWSNGTDEEIAMAVKQADAGVIDLYEDLGWRVGDERLFTFGAFPNEGTWIDEEGIERSWKQSYGGDPSTVQTMVLMDRDHYELVSPVRDKYGNIRSMCSFVVGMKEMPGYMRMYINEEYYPGWKICTGRPRLNAGFRSVINDTLRPIFKRFKVVTAESKDANDLVTTYDYFTCPAAKEVTGTAYGSNPYEADALTQIEYYKTQTNWYKTYYGKTDTENWPLRSMYIGSGHNNPCMVYGGYVTSFNGSSYSNSMSPIGVI